ncbi:MAG: hypothetical protein AB1599_09845 [Planctomycetota bacterium]
MKKNKPSCRKACDKVAVDLMHLAMNDYSEINDAKGLMDHIKACNKCRINLHKMKEVDVFAFLASPRSAKYKKGMKKLIETARAKSGSNGNHNNCDDDKGDK